MKVALIGNGAIAGYVRAKQGDDGYEVAALLLRSERVAAMPEADLQLVSSVSDLPREIELVADCAGHQALRTYGPDILRSGRGLITVSIGALADDDLLQELHQAAREGGSCLHLASGALGGLDCLSAAAVGSLSSVKYIGRKPPKGWEGSLAEDVLDLTSMTDGAQTHFTGTARQAALAYPKNANVAAAVALAGLGFDATQVELIADPDITKNLHEVQARGDFGDFTFQISGETMPTSPRTSALAAMSVVSKIRSLSASIKL